MKRDNFKLEICFKIYFKLLKNKKVTCGELAKEFNLHSRTIYRYLTKMSLILPIFTQQGYNGGFYFLEENKL